jgi:hypothetical protein
MFRDTPGQSGAGHENEAQARPQHSEDDDHAQQAEQLGVVIIDGPVAHAGQHGRDHIQIRWGRVGGSIEFPLRARDSTPDARSEHRTTQHRHMLGDWPERQGREIREAPDDHDHAEQQTDPQGPCCGQRAVDAATRRRVASDPASASTGTTTMKRPTAIPSASVRL